MDLHFFVGGEDKFSNQSLKDKPQEQLRFLSQKFSDVLSIPNLSFLVGAGCSSFKDSSGNEKGIPTMKSLAPEIKEIPEVVAFIKNYHDPDLSNFEDFLGYLYRLKQIILDQGGEVENSDEQKAIVEIKKFLIDKCAVDSSEVQTLYESFYRKLMIRPSNLPRLNIFTTNYDLFSERALDELGIIYANGFRGTVSRNFDPATFRYGLYKEVDLKSAKLTEIDNFIYLFKLHGSINWKYETESGSVSETTSGVLPDDESETMIYPTPSKQESSLGMPYFDLFREFQAKLMQNNNALVCVGYSFADEHVNRAIYQALTIPTFRLIILGSSIDEVERLQSLDDPRIWIINGETETSKLHYFDSFVEHVLPNLEGQRIDTAIEKVEENLLRKDLLRKQAGDETVSASKAVSDDPAF